MTADILLGEFKKSVLTGSPGLPLSSSLPPNYPPRLLIFFNVFASISSSLSLHLSAVELAPSSLSWVFTEAPNQILCPLFLSIYKDALSLKQEKIQTKAS